MTPGPWEVQLSNSGARVTAGNVQICAALAGNRANARLISAAPDMLEALKGLLDRFYAPSCPEWDAVRAAIAKAEGDLR